MGSFQDMRQLQFISQSPEDTKNLGFVIGNYSNPGDVVLLSGDLGTGKTCLTQGIAEGMGVEGYVRSPTFVLVTIHQGSMPLYHMDLYRMDSSAEVLELGIDEYLYGDGLSAVEWADKAIEVFPEPYLLIQLSHIDETSRTIKITPVGSRYDNMINEIQNRLQI